MSLLSAKIKVIMPGDKSIRLESDSLDQVALGLALVRMIPQGFCPLVLPNPGRAVVRSVANLLKKVEILEKICDEQIPKMDKNYPNYANLRESLERYHFIQREDSTCLNMLCEDEGGEFQIPLSRKFIVTKSNPDRAVTVLKESQISFYAFTCGAVPRAFRPHDHLAVNSESSDSKEELEELLSRPVPEGEIVTVVNGA